MKHLIDFNILKEWGFDWSSVENINGEQLVTGYIKTSTTESDFHSFKPLSLAMHSNLNINQYWILARISEEDHDILFKGKINDIDALKCILDACVVFKPETDDK